MVRKMRIGLLCLVLVLVSLSENMVSEASSTVCSESPAPQPTMLPLHGYTQGILQPEDCLPWCKGRCSATQHRKPCMFFCQKCCAKCLCVPPGAYGNKQACPCYNDWKTKRGGPKCP